MLRKGFLFFCLVLTHFDSVQAQTTEGTDSVAYAFLPAIAFNSDLGFILGGIANRYDYKDRVPPFYSFVSVNGIFSTRGFASFEVFLDKPNVFDTNMRLTSSMYSSRFLQDAYFGVANYSKIDLSQTPFSGYYEFQSFSVGLNTTLRFPLLVNSRYQRLDLLGILNLDYNTPWENGTERLISQEKPTGFKGGRTFMFGSGIIWEGRNSEFNPTKGTYIESSFEIGNTFWGSSFSTVVVEHDMRHYFSFHILRDITFANRFYLRHTSGDTPYWMLSYAGDDQTLRGYPARRFLDDNVLILNNELRTWLFDFSSINTKLGGTIFVDVGRTFSNQTSIHTLTKELKYTYGFGGTSSLFTPDFIIRADIGFSDEDTGVYITIGYMF